MHSVLLVYTMPERETSSVSLPCAGNCLVGTCLLIGAAYDAAMRRHKSRLLSFYTVGRALSQSCLTLLVLCGAIAMPASDSDSDSDYD